MSGYDVVYGIRELRQKKNFLRKFLYFSYHKVFKLLSDLKNNEDLVDFCLIDVKVKNELINLKENNVYFRGLRSWVGFKQIGILYEQKEREIGETKYSLNKLFQLALDGILNFSVKPLNFIFIIGLGMFVVSLFGIVFFFIAKIIRVFFFRNLPTRSKRIFCINHNSFVFWRNQSYGPRYNRRIYRKVV